MLFKIIMWGSIFWIVPLMNYIFINNAKFKKNIAVGVTFREEGKCDADVKARLDKYKKQIKKISLLLLVLIVPGLFIETMWIMLTYWLVWIDMVILAYPIPFYLCNRDLKKIKREKGFVYGSSERVFVDTDNVPKFKNLSPLLFIIPCILSLLPLVWDRVSWIIYVTSAVCIAVFYIMYRYFYRNRSEAVNDEKNLTRVLTQIRHYNWSKIWLVASWLMVALSYTGLLLLSYPTMALAAVFIISTVICAEAIIIEIKIRKMQEKLTVGSGTESIVDEDDRWLGGMIYYNPNDSHLLINDRVGMNTNINMAHTLGKVIVAVLLVTIIAMPFTGPAMYIYYKEPITIQVSSDEISASQGITNYHIRLADVEKTEIITKLPDDLFRVNGTSFENLLKGHFRSKTTNLILLLRTDEEAFMKITKKNGEIFILSRPKEEVQVLKP